MNWDRPMLIYIIEMAKYKYKERFLQAAREKQSIVSKGVPMRLSADFSTENLKARSEWHNIFKVPKGKSLQLRILYCDPMDRTLQGSSIHGISQARVLEWVAISFYQRIFPTQGSNPGLLPCKKTIYHLSHQGRQL